MLKQMPLNQAFLKRLLLFRHQTQKDLIFLNFLRVCVFYIYVFSFTYQRKIIA